MNVEIGTEAAQLPEKEYIKFKINRNLSMFLICILYTYCNVLVHFGES
jgi:hypothetical protein